MIVPTMTLPEVADAARRDLVHLQRRIERDRVRMERRHLRNGRHEPLAGFGEYTSPDQLRWMYVLTVTPRRTMLYPLVWYLSRHGLHALHIAEDGIDVHYAPGVLQRYREHRDPGADVLQALRNFFLRNHAVVAEPTPNARYGPKAIAGLLDQGLVLGVHDRESGIALFNTYVPAQQLRQEQEELALRLDLRRYFAHPTPDQVQATRYFHELEDLMARLEQLDRPAEGSLGSAA